MNHCHDSNQIANYAFRLGEEQARADEAMQYAQEHLSEMVAYLLSGNDLTFASSPNIDAQSLIDELTEEDGEEGSKDENIILKLFNLFMMDSSDHAEMGRAFVEKMHDIATRLVTDHFAEHGELPIQFNLDEAA